MPEIWARLLPLFSTVPPNYLDNLNFLVPVASRMLIVITARRAMWLMEDAITLVNTLKSAGGTTWILLHPKVAKTIFRLKNCDIDSFSTALLNAWKLEQKISKEVFIAEVERRYVRPLCRGPGSSGFRCVVRSSLVD